MAGPSAEAVMPVTALTICRVSQSHVPVGHAAAPQQVSALARSSDGRRSIRICALFIILTSPTYAQPKVSPNKLALSVPPSLILVRRIRVSVRPVGPATNMLQILPGCREFRLYVCQG